MLMERSGIVIERGDVPIDLGAPDDVSGEWVEDRVTTPGFRVIVKKRRYGDAQLNTRPAARISR